MRRSAAPSQAGCRPKFVAPFKQSFTSVTPAEVKQASKETISTVGLAEEDSAVTESRVQIHGNVEATAIQAEQQFEAQPAKRPRFEIPAAGRKHYGPVQPPQQAGRGDGIHFGNKENFEKKQSLVTRYFNVVWCKRSNKKHKKWEGDAVLLTSGRSVTLFDTEGKEIGKGSGYKSTELLSLKEDETLLIGGKEIQVMSVLTEEQFRSGKCFTGSCVDQSTLDTVASRMPVSKPFSKPLRPSSTLVLPSPEPVDVKSRHDPTVPGALVLPRPNRSHQWQWNKHEMVVVDVVVDPYLAQHLRPHQREGVVFLYECVMGYRDYGGCGAILADDMGLGKTLQCIALIWTLYKQGPYGGKSVAKKVLIITPGSLVKNWKQEFKKWLGFERLQVFAVSADNKVEEYLKTSIYPVLIISYEMFVRMYGLLQHLNFDIVVCDEGHRLKNTAIKTTSLIMGLSTQRRVVLTGTPIQNDLQEFFSIVEFCNPGVLGSSAAFKRVYEDPIVSSRQPQATPAEVSLGEDRGTQLSRMTQMFVLRRTNEINNKYLPPKCEVVVFCRATGLQLSLYNRLLRCQLVRSCLSGGPGGSPHLICIAALKQLCNHPRLVYNKAVKVVKDDLSNGLNDISGVYDGLLPLFPADFSSDRDLECHSGKLFVLSQLLHQLHTSLKTEKIVVVSNHTKTLDLIQGMCDNKSYQYLRLDGQTPTGKRQELVQRFNSKHSHDFIFLLSSKAGGVGLNLVGASRLVLYDIDWNPANDLQAMARVWRDGQKKKVHIYRLLTTGSIEEKIYQRQICKQGLSGAVMDIGAKKNVQFSLEDLKDLFSINLHTDCDTHDLLSCDCLVHRQSVREPVQETTTRVCQLGARIPVKKKNLGMDELMEWTHSPGAVVQEHMDWVLQEAEEGISFVFHSEVKTEL